MGSLDRYCRLCAQAVRPDQLQPLYCGDPGHTTESQVHFSLQAVLVCNLWSSGRWETAQLPWIRRGGRGQAAKTGQVHSTSRIAGKIIVRCSNLSLVRISQFAMCTAGVPAVPGGAGLLCRLGGPVPQGGVTAAGTLAVSPPTLISPVQRGLDVDFVASEADYRYTYLFPAPYPAHHSAVPSAPAPDAAPFFGPTSQESMTALPAPPPVPPTEPGSTPTSAQAPTQAPATVNTSISTTATSVSTAQHKVPMYKNDVTVDNLVVELGPQDLIPRKSGNIRPEYPWRVGGATRRAAAARERKVSGGRGGGGATLQGVVRGAAQQAKRMRPLLPKMSCPEVEGGGGGGVGGGPVSQIMIPVTLKTPCKNCNQVIVAASLQDIKSHRCGEEVELRCGIPGCDLRLPSKVVCSNITGLNRFKRVS